MDRSARIAVVTLLLLLVAVLSVRGVGVSVSYFLPRNGMFSHPVTPLSLRDIDFDIGRFLGVGCSLSLYSMRGMGITDAEGDPIASDGPLVGPFLSVLSSAVAKLKLPIPPLDFEASGGVFGCYNIDPPLMTGNLDRYLATATGTTYEAVTSTVRADGRWGWGWVFGGSATYFLKGQFGIYAGANYYLGGGNLKLSGSYDAYDDGGAGWVTGQDLPAILKTARLDFSGLEIILGVELQL